MRHGLLAKCVVLPEESGELFEAMLCQHLDRFQPADGVEFAMVEGLASAYWRMRRAWAVETAMIGGALHAQPPEGRGVARLAAAFGVLASEPGLPLIHRYEARLHRMYQRALRNLLMLQDAAPDRDPPDEMAMPDSPPQPVETGAVDEEAPRVPDPADPGGPEGPLDPPPHPVPGASEGGEDPVTVDAFPEKEPVDH